MAAAFLVVVVFFVAFFLAGFLFSAGFRLAAFGPASSCAAGPFHSSRATMPEARLPRWQEVPQPTGDVPDTWVRL